jgi:predicted nucleic acid-binding protein
MKYILDSSVAIKVVLPEPDSAKATALLNDYLNQVHELLAPDVFGVEVAHALTKAERKNLLKQGESLHKLAHVLSTGPAFHPYLPLLPRAAEISSKMWVGVYDCLYVALAEQERCDVVTADAKLIKALPGFPIIDLSTLP